MSYLYYRNIFVLRKKEISLSFTAGDQAILLEFVRTRAENKYSTTDLMSLLTPHFRRHDQVKPKKLVKFFILSVKMMYATGRDDLVAVRRLYGDVSLHA